MFAHLGHIPAIYIGIACVSLCLLAMGPVPAFAGDVDCAAATAAGCGFGAAAGAPLTTAITGTDWSGSLTAAAFLNNGIYTYLYDFTLLPNSAQTAALNVSYFNGINNFDTFDPTLNFGVLTNGNFTSAGVDDCADTAGAGCDGGTKTGFSFGNSFLFTNVSNLGPIAAGGNNLDYTFYAQSKNGPITGSFGGQSFTSGLTFDSTIVPAPEPSSLVLLGTAMTGMLGFRFRTRRGRAKKGQKKSAMTVPLASRAVAFSARCGRD